MGTRVKFLLLIVLMSISMLGFAQSLPVQVDEAKNAEMREKIGLDLVVPDFETKKIDAKLMGGRLAGILNYLMDNYQQSVYDRRLSAIVSEQNKALENVYFQLKKMKFVSAVKKGNEITIIMRVDFQKKAANIKQAEVTFHFIDGLSESDMVNEMFSHISHYVQARERLEY